MPQVLTGFTHPRRLELIRLLHARPMTVRQLADATGFSQQAISRHLAKLLKRELVADAGDWMWRLIRPKGQLEKTLIEITCG